PRPWRHGRCAARRPRPSMRDGSRRMHQPKLAPTSAAHDATSPPPLVPPPETRPAAAASTRTRRAPRAALGGTASPVAAAPSGHTPPADRRPIPPGPPAPRAYPLWEAAASSRAAALQSRLFTSTPSWYARRRIPYYPYPRSPQPFANRSGGRGSRSPPSWKPHTYERGILAVVQQHRPLMSDRADC